MHAFVIHGIRVRVRYSSNLIGWHPRSAEMQAKNKNGYCMLNALSVLEDIACVNVPLVLVKLDRPMIESSGLMMLDHSLCVCCVTTWTRLTHAIV